MELISTKNQLPERNQYVLIHLTKNNWGDDDDPKGNRYWTVAKFIRGMPEEECAALGEYDKRKRMYTIADVFGNNLVPYCWDTFGPGTYFGQEVDYWCELPELEAIEKAAADMANDGAEWVCPECNDKGTYLAIRTPLDRGVDSCPECGTEVKPFES